METHLVIARLAASRARLRSLMLSPSLEEGMDDGESFTPRSKLMRVLLDSRLRGLSVSLVGSVASMLLRRRAARLERSQGFTQTLASMLAALRNRD